MPVVILCFIYGKVNDGELILVVPVDPANMRH